MALPGFRKSITVSIFPLCDFRFSAVVGFPIADHRKLSLDYVKNVKILSSCPSMRIKHLFVLINIRNKGEVCTTKLV